MTISWLSYIIKTQTVLLSLSHALLYESSAIGIFPLVILKQVKSLQPNYLQKALPEFLVAPVQGLQIPFTLTSR